MVPDDMGGSPPADGSAPGGNSDGSVNGSTDMGAHGGGDGGDTSGKGSGCSTSGRAPLGTSILWCLLPLLWLRRRAIFRDVR
jgi:hypothetical protein